jgi:hypothetical protein
MASNTYHKLNVLKFRIMETLVKSRPTSLTCNEIAKKTGIPVNKISRAMSHYHSHSYGYFHRLKKKEHRAYRYSITKYGRSTYLKYLKRIKIGFDLNCKATKIKRMANFRGLHKIIIKTAADLEISPEQFQDYLGITPQGRKLGLTQADVLRLSGLV